MTTDWLILDCNNMYWRSFHALGHLYFRQEPIGPVYGFFRDLIALRESFRPDNVVFCFDAPANTNLRLKTFPGYKANRTKRAADPREVKAKEKARSQIDDLRLEYLPSLGFRNIVWYWGYEADDIIASACGTVQPDQEAVVVSNDKDVLQLIRGNISVWNYKRMVSLQKFKQEYGITPQQWPMVKALGGCVSDGIPSIKGVGEITALKYVKAVLPPTSSYHKRIIADHKVWQDNLPLVTLPFEGCPKFTPHEDDFNFTAWEKLCEQLGMATLLKKPPSGGKHHQRTTI